MRPAILVTARPTRRSPLAHAAPVAKLRFACADWIGETTTVRRGETIAARQAQLIVLGGILGELQARCASRRVESSRNSPWHSCGRRPTIAGGIDVGPTSRGAADVVSRARRIVHEADGIRADRHGTGEQAVRAAVARPGAAPRSDPF